MKDGLLPVVAATGGVAAVLLWSLSVNDPYWRLFETPSVPAPAYEAPEDLLAVLAGATPEISNNNAGAMNPAADPLASARRADIYLGIPLDISLREAEAAAIPEPMIALVPPLEPEPMAGPAIEQMFAYRLPRAALPAPAGFEPDTLETDTGLAFAPMPVPVPVALRDPGVGAVAQAVSLAAPSAAPELAPIARERQVASAGDDDRCARRSDGRIIKRQSLGCDLAGFAEQFVSLGRNILNDEDGSEDDDTVEIAAHTPFVLASGTNR